MTIAFSEAEAGPAKTAQNDSSSLVALDKYLQSLGRSRSTFWRWEQKGLVKSVNVFGRNYITRDEIRRFEEAAISGALARELKPSIPSLSGDA